MLMRICLQPPKAAQKDGRVRIELAELALRALVAGGEVSQGC